MAAPKVFCYRKHMPQTNATAKFAGRLGMLLAFVGCLLFFAGIFGAPRVLAFAGLVLIVISLATFFIEEQSIRKA